VYTFGVDAGLGIDCSQFPAKEVNEFEQQVKEIQEEVHVDRYTHEGKTAEQAYEDKLAYLSLTEGGEQDGATVVKALLIRCTLWIEIMREKYVHAKPQKLLPVATLTQHTDRARSTSASKNPTTNCSKSATSSNK
jgi:hypothetical protein